MEDRIVVMNGVKYNLLTDEDIEDIKICAVIEYKEELRKKNKLKFNSSEDIRKMFEMK